MPKNSNKFKIFFGLLIIIGIIIYIVIPIKCEASGVGGEKCEKNPIKDFLNIFLGFGILLFILFIFFEKKLDKLIKNPSDKI